MANSDAPNDISDLLTGDMTQTPKQLSTSDMALLLNSDSIELDAVSNIGQNVNVASLDVLDTVNNAGKDTTDNSQNIIPQAVVVTQSQVLNSNQVSLLNSSGKRVILQPANPSMNAIVQNLVQNQAFVQGVKRPGSGSQVVTKFIIQKNASGDQQPVLVQRQSKSNSSNTSQSFNIIVTSSGTATTSVTSALTGGPQTITISGGGVLTASDIARTIHTSNGKMTVTPTTTTKIRMIPVSSVHVKSPQRVIPVTIHNNAMITKGVQKPALTGQLTKPAASLGNYQPVQVAGSKFNYVRLVNSSSASGSSPSTVSLVQTIAKPIVPSSTNSQTTPQVRIQLANNSTAGQNQPIITKHVSGQLQRVILPESSTQATSLLRPSVSTPEQVSIPVNRPSIRPMVTNVSQASTVKLPDGVSVLPSSATVTSTAGPVVQGGSASIPSGFTLVPAQYINSLVSQKTQSQTAQIPSQVPLRPKHDPFSPLAVQSSVTPNVDVDISSHLNGSNNGLTEAPGTRPRKPCNCTKSQCLKLYCDCFANGEFCNGCNCTNCYNNLPHEEERSKAIRSCLERNPNAFHPKIGKAGIIGGDGERRHTKGCNCKKSGCLKNYCECYEAKISCSDMCRCVGCKNVDEFEQQQNLMALADVAETRVQHIQARKARLHENKGVNSRLPYTFVTTEVGEATCACLLAQAEDSEREKHTVQMEERLILQEYGRCLQQIIESANRTKSIQDSMG